MSSSAPGGSGGEKPQIFSKFIRRASKVLRKRDSTRGSISSISEVAPTSSTRAPSIPQPPPGESVATPTPTSVPAAVQQSIIDIDTSSNKVTNVPITASANYAMQEEKARALFAKYGLTLEPREWTPASKGDGGRVEKKIRMRVHRHCHRCQTTFGPEKLCKNCQHTRCKKCPRIPAKKPKDQKLKDIETGVVPISTQEASRAKMKATRTLTMPSKTPGAELIRKGPRQRVRRICHKCSTVFHGKETQCGICQHLRCPFCPREPPKLHKYPNGYPGDTEESFPLAERQLRAIRTRIRWQCHSCSEMFKENEKTCSNCKHERCDECTRDPPRKTELEPDESTVQSVENRLANVNISPQAA